MIGLGIKTVMMVVLKPQKFPVDRNSETAVQIDAISNAFGGKPLPSIVISLKFNASHIAGEVPKRNKKQIHTKARVSRNLAKSIHTGFEGTNFHEKILYYIPC